MQTSVLFLRLHHPEQGRQELVAAAEAAVQAWEPDQRVVLEATEGLAIVGQGDALVAMEAARQAAAVGGAAIAIGLAHGEVAAAQAADGVQVEGEALATAAATAAAAEGETIAMSPAFREALAASQSRLTRRRVLGVGGIAGILVLGGAVRLVRSALEAARPPAVLLLDIRPSGEIFVDGELKGTSPPLVRLSIAPGAHTIEIRNGRFRPVTMNVTLQPGEQLQLRHVFASPGAGRRPSLIDRLKSWF